MIRKIEVKNFKSLKDIYLNFRKVNLFIGEPNTGKSNLLEVFGMLSFCWYGMKYGFRLNDFVRFENISNLFFDENVEDNIIIRDITDNITFNLSLTKNLLFGGSIKYGIKQIPLFEIDFAGNVTAHLFREQNEIVNELIRKYLKRIKFYHFERKKLFKNKQITFLLPPYGDNLLSVLMTNKELKSIIADLLKHFNYRLMFKPQEDKIEIVKEKDDVLISIPYPLISDTFQRLIFYLTAILSNKNSILIFQEPETHTFPYYTKFLAECIALDDKNNQFFISTHNPYFLLSVLEKSKKEDIAIFIVYMKNFETKVKMLTENEIEEILNQGIDIFFNLDRFIDEK